MLDRIRRPIFTNGTIDLKSVQSFKLFIAKSSSLTVKKMRELLTKATAVQFRSYFMNKYVNIVIGL